MQASCLALNEGDTVVRTQRTQIDRKRPARAVLTN
jgi:hypothetical protein